MDKNNYLMVAAFQGSINEGNGNASLNKVLEVAALAEKRGVDILCFPETYLHGYFASKKHAFQHAINLHSHEFETLCERFLPFQQVTVLLGLNELEEGRIFNTVVVIEKGKCIGKYRKAYSYVPYDYYSLGREFPVFEKKGVKYGVIICLDSNYREPAYITALNGARVIFCPMFNRVEKDPKVLNFVNKMIGREHFITRAFDNNCWIVASDIVWNDHDELCPGYACILNDNGEFVVKSEPFQEMLLTYSIPLKNLRQRKRIRLLGNPELFEIVKESYERAIEEEESLVLPTDIKE